MKCEMKCETLLKKMLKKVEKIAGKLANHPLVCYNTHVSVMHKYSLFAKNDMHDK